MGWNALEYLEANLTGMQDAGSVERSADCLWCGKAGHMYVNIETGSYICFRCDERGRGFVGIVAQVEGLSWAKARRWLMQKAVRRRKPGHLDLERIIAELSGPEVEPTRVEVKLPSEFMPVHDERTGRWRYPSYLRSRGVEPKTAAHFGMGTCRSGRYRRRVVVPIRCPNGQSFTARDVRRKARLRYLNPRKDEGAEHHRLLHGYDELRDGADFIVVEGPFDVVNLWQFGMPAVGVLGKTLSAPQLEMLMRRPRGAAVVMLDPEEHDATDKVARTLRCAFADVYVAELPAGVDPGSATQAQARAAFVNARRYRGDRAKGLARLVAAACDAELFDYSA